MLKTYVPREGPTTCGQICPLARIQKQTTSGQICLLARIQKQTTCVFTIHTTCVFASIYASNPLEIHSRNSTKKQESLKFNISRTETNYEKPFGKNLVHYMMNRYASFCGIRSRSPRDILITRFSRNLKKLPQALGNNFFEENARLRTFSDVYS